MPEYSFEALSAKTGVRTGVVVADTYDQAAQLVVKRLWPNKRYVFARRHTGDSKLSGWFTVFESGKTVGGGANNIGPLFHLSQDD
jgi:hypothetical protein